MADESPRRVMPRRVADVTLPAPYDCFTVSLWVNIPQALWRELMGTDIDKCAAAFGQVVVAHDLVDFDGAPYPPAGTAELYRALPADLVRVIEQARVAQIGRLSPPSAGS